MRLGCVVRDLAEAEHADRLPLDYLELKGDMLCVAPDEARSLCARLRSLGSPVSAMTSPLPRRFGCRVVGADADLPRALAVFQEVCGLGAEAGVRTVVLGSGQARSVPDGFPHETALAQFGDFVTSAAGWCADRGMTLVLEPLNRTETNFVNSCAEARAVVDELAGTGVGIAVDCYHIVTERLSVADEVAAAAGVIGHAHTSPVPRKTNDFRVDTQAEFITALTAAGYAGGFTIEGELADFHRDAAHAVAVFRGLLASAGPTRRQTREAGDDGTVVPQ